MKMNELLEILKLVTNDDDKSKTSSRYEKYIGEYVLVRDGNEGINFGKVVDIDETGVELSGARRLWEHKGESESRYEGVAKTGLSKDSKVSCPGDKVIIGNNFSITLVDNNAVQSLLSHPSHS